MIDNWGNVESFGRAGTGKQEPSARAPQPDRHGCSGLKQVAGEAKATKFTVRVVAGKATISDKRRGG